MMLIKKKSGKEIPSSEITPTGSSIYPRRTFMKSATAVTAAGTTVSGLPSRASQRQTPSVEPVVCQLKQQQSQVRQFL